MALLIAAAYTYYHRKQRGACRPSPTIPRCLRKQANETKRGGSLHGLCSSFKPFAVSYVGDNDRWGVCRHNRYRDIYYAAGFPQTGSTQTDATVAEEGREQEPLEMAEERLHSQNPPNR